MNPDVRMSDPMENLESKMPDEFKGLQEYLLNNFSEVPEVLDPQIGWLVRNLAYHRALTAALSAQVNDLELLVHQLVHAITGGTDEVSG